MAWMDANSQQPDLPNHEEGAGEEMEVEALENDPSTEATSPWTTDTSWTTETSIETKEKRRRPRASKQQPSGAAKGAASGCEDRGTGEAQAWVGVVGQSRSDGVSWGPVTKSGFATFMHACGQAIDFHEFNLKELIRFTKDLEIVDCYVKDSPDYVKATVQYIWDLWATWNTDSVEDVAYWLMESSVPQILLPALKC